MKELLRKKQEGFTLIELLIVMVIIGLLALLVVNQFTSARDRADDSKVKSDIAQLANAIEVVYADDNQYPITADMDTVAEIATTLGVKEDSAQDPDGDVYTYTAFAADGITACDNTTTDCKTYTISGPLTDGTTFDKTSN